MACFIKRLRRCFVTALAVIFALSVLPIGLALAQTDELDFQAPIVEHEAVDSGQLGDTQVFVATVVDNIELKNVRLFFRFDGEEDFQSTEMEPLNESSLHSAGVVTSDVEAASIEYYIQAEDVAGNIVLKGYAFDPLIRLLEPASDTQALSTAQTDSTSAPEAPVATPAPPQVKKRSKFLYIALGVLLLGGLAAAAGGGSDDGGSTGGTTPTGNCCTVTLTISPP